MEIVSTWKNLWPVEKKQELIKIGTKNYITLFLIKTSFTASRNFFALFNESCAGPRLSFESLWY